MNVQNTEAWNVFRERSGVSVRSILAHRSREARAQSVRWAAPMSEPDASEESLLEKYRAALPPAKRLTRTEQAELSDRLFLSLDKNQRSAKDRAAERDAELQRTHAGLFRPQTNSGSRVKAKRPVPGRQSAAARQIQTKWRQKKGGAPSSAASASPAGAAGSRRTADGDAEPGSEGRLVALCERGDWTAVRQLLQASLDLGGLSGAELNGSGRGGKRPLHLATKADAVAAELLVVAGAERPGVAQLALLALLPRLLL